MSGGREAAFSVLRKVSSRDSENEVSLRALLDDEILRLKLDGREAALAQEICYGVLRRRGSVDWTLARLVDRPLKKLSPALLPVLRIGIYQILYLDRVPPHAAVHETVELVKRHGHKGMVSMTNAVLRRALRERETETGLSIPSIESSDPAERAAALELPEWFLTRIERRLGKDEAVRFAEASLQIPRPAVRVNLMRFTRDELSSRLAEAGYKTKPCVYAENGLNFIENESGEHPSRHPLFAQGAYTMQDEASILAGGALPLSRGDTVLDCCAAPGGKSCHLAERLTLLGGGIVEAWDLSKEKAARIQANAARLGLSNIQSHVRNILENPLEHTYSRILVDAPCGNWGTIRRRPDVKWRRKERDLARLGELQTRILGTALEALEKSGVLIYSVCTVDEEETTEVIRRILQEREDLCVVDPLPCLPEAYLPQERGRFLWPHRHNTDGFFISRLERRG